LGAALAAVLNVGCGPSATTPDASVAPDAPDAPDATVTPDVPAPPDVAVTPDATVAQDVAAMADSPAPRDAANDTSTAMDAAPADVTDASVDGPLPDVAAPPAQAIVGLVRANNAALYRVGSGTVAPAGAASWNECAASYSLVGRDFQPNGFWLCASNPLADRRFYVGNVVGGAATFWSLQRGNVTARGAGVRDACPTGSLLGRSGGDGDGFWLCMDAPLAGRWAAAWEFDDSSHGWTPNGMPRITVAGGRLTYAEGGSDPYLTSPDGLDLDASNSVVYVGLRNATASPEARVYFTTTAAGATAFSEARSVGAGTLTNDAATREIVFDMSTNPEWRGTIRRLRIDPGTAAGPYEIDYLRVGPTDNRALAPSWDFTRGDEGWSPANGTSTVTDGVFTLRVNADDASISHVGLSFSAARARLRMRVRNGLPETAGEVFFSTAAAPGFVASRSVSFVMTTSDPSRREYVADMSRDPAWSGTITGLRLDFGQTGRGDVEVDWIGLDE
jgi:hypothetical protein